MTTVPAQSFSAPARACVIAAARFMPGVCGVLMSSSFECTTRTPLNFHFESAIGGRLYTLAATRRQRLVGAGARALVDARLRRGLDAAVLSDVLVGEPLHQGVKALIELGVLDRLASLQPQRLV